MGFLFQAFPLASAHLMNSQNAELMLETLGFKDYFDALVIGPECAHGKPHPDPYRTALQQLGVDPSNVCQGGGRRGADAGPSLVTSRRQAGRVGRREGGKNVARVRPQGHKGKHMHSSM